MTRRGSTENRGEAPPRIHPPINTITDALTFRTARFNLLLERLGSGNFRKRFGITLNEWRVIGLTHATEKATVTSIRAELSMDKGQLSRTVSSLADRGLVRTATGTTDRRVIQVSLSPQGRTLHDEVLAEVISRNEQVVGCLGAGECAEFLRLLDKLTALAEARARQEGVA